MKRFGQVTREARMARGWSLQTAADRLCTFKGYVCGIERGNINPPSPKLIKRYAAVFGLSFDDLLARAAIEKLPKAVKLETVYDLLRERIDSRRPKTA